MVDEGRIGNIQMVSFMFSRDCHAVTGFFEDLPVLVVVLVAIVVFLLGIISAYNKYSAQHEDLAFAQEAQHFSDSIKGYDRLLYNNIYGMFDARKLQSISIEDIRQDLRTHYEFRIEIIDVSSYPTKYDIVLETSPVPSPGEVGEGDNEHLPKIGRGVVVSSVNVWVSEEEIHAAKLIVTIWE